MNITCPYEIKEITRNNSAISEAMKLVWEVFAEFEAPDYSEVGIQEFRRFIELEAVKDRVSRDELKIWACFDEGNIIGVIASKPLTHISLLFVDKRYHRKGIARSLLYTVLEYFNEIVCGREWLESTKMSELSVNSSPYAVEIYQKLGFVETDKERTVNGIRFTPMKYVGRVE